MSLPVEILRALIESGASAETILAAAEAAEARARADQDAAQRKDEERKARAREGNRRRQRAWYDRHVRGEEDNAVISKPNEDNEPNAVKQREEREDLEQKKVLEPKKNPSGITTSSTPSGSQVPSSEKPRCHFWPEDFEDRFWEAYPRHTDRKKAMVALGRVRRGDRVAFADLIGGCERLAASGTDRAFLPHPSTWLNNERWRDEIPERPMAPNARGSPAGFHNRGNGLNDLAEQKAGGDESIYRDPFSDFDRPSRRSSGAASGPDPGREEAGRYDARGHAEDGSGLVLDFERPRAHGR